MRATARLPPSFYLIRDTTYRLSEQLLTPFPRRNLALDEDSFNFHLSQCRVRVEMAFGVFVQAWVKTRGPTDFLRLHNFPHDEHVTPVVVAEEDEESRGRGPSLNPDNGDGDVMLPEGQRTRRHVRR